VSLYLIDKGCYRSGRGHRGICSKSYAKELGTVSSIIEQAPDRGATYIELLGDGGFAQPFASEVSYFLRLPDDFGGATVRAALFAGLSDPGFHSIAQNVAFELGEHRQHAGEGPSAWRRQIERLAQRDEPDFHNRKFLQCTDEIDERASPAIEPPHDDDIDFPSSRGAQQFLPTRTSFSAGADFLDHQRDLPALPFGVGAHCFELHGQRLLIVGRHPGVDCDPIGFDPGQKPLQIGVA